MPVYKIKQEPENIDYTVFAIRSILADFHLVYNLNRVLKVGLKRNRKDYEIDEGLYLTRFSWKDRKLQTNWALFSNFTEITTNITNKNALFPIQRIETRHYLLPEIKEANYILKIDQDQSSPRMDTILQKINTVQQIQSAWKIETEKLESKNNLIF